MPTTRSTVSTSSTLQAVVGTVPKTYGAFKVVCKAQRTSGTPHVHAMEMLVVHDGTQLYVTQYAELDTGAGELGTWDVDFNGANVRLLFTPTTSLGLSVTATYHPL